MRITAVTTMGNFGNSSNKVEGKTQVIAEKARIAVAAVWSTSEDDVIRIKKMTAGLDITFMAALLNDVCIFAELFRGLIISPWKL